MEQKFWFHCGKCGSLFLSGHGLWAGRRCSTCHRSPGSEVIQISEIYESEKKISSGKHSSRRKRSFSTVQRLLILGLIVWTAGIGFLMLNGWKKEKQISQRSADSEAHALEMKQRVADDRVIEAELPKLKALLSGFLATSVLEAKGKLIDDPGALAGKMARFYTLNPALSFKATSITFQEAEILRTGNEQLIVTRWTTNHQQTLEAAFRKLEGGWKLDWLDFERYSDFPLSSFVTTDGDAQGEFRVLARQRQSEQTADDFLKVVFYAAENGSAKPLGSQSPDVLVKKDSPAGKALLRAFELEKSGKQIFGAQLPRHEPEGVIRVKVKLSRSGSGDQRKFVLDEVQAAHWFNTAVTGLE